MKLTVYSRLYCHLCEDLLARLEALRAELGFRYEVVDVDEDPALVARYNHLVPVLAAGKHEICHHFLDEPALRHYLDAR
jgi:glutaredoxin